MWTYGVTQFVTSGWVQSTEPVLLSNHYLGDFPKFQCKVLTFSVSSGFWCSACDSDGVCSLPVYSAAFCSWTLILYSETFFSQSVKSNSFFSLTGETWVRLIRRVSTCSVSLWTQCDVFSSGQSWTCDRDFQSKSLLSELLAAPLCSVDVIDYFATEENFSGSQRLPSVWVWVDL